MLNQKNTDNILYNKPYQLVLWTISTKRKMHICTVTFTSWCWQWGRGLFLIATFGKPPLWASAYSKHRKDRVTHNYPLLRVLGYYMFNMIIFCPFPKNYPSFKRPFKSFVHYENPTGSRALGKDEGCQKRRQETKPKSRSCKIIFPFTKGN